ncbi:MAG TPA: adenylate/guanylate cyclase domain-containing protein [Leptospiraceae bacterium]|nr:adenylate/guanylate cyclase domain-containing protein [Leptospiraceae bacterium]HNF53209.1 adenylate/guanylate cyclase domain-containing protein [Leptospiraceae bacterium]HNL71278.1 adenylate/guanylate cyclase domain-containing protein [Leptospiraceae bacterium]HNM87078.1 adenylate/guanylate cyclase domain-containing protein [Leptospiraceae bacterium]
MPISPMTARATKPAKPKKEKNSFDLKEILLKIPMFSNLSHEALDLVIQICQTRKLKKNEILFKEGDAGDFAYIIEAGKIEIFTEISGDKVIFATKGSGTIIGELALLDKSPRMASVRAVEPCRVVGIGAKEFMDLVTTQPAIANGVLQDVVARWRQNEGILKKREKELQQAKQLIELQRQKSEELLLNILPKAVADELKLNGATQPLHYDSVTVIFTDFKGFTKISEQMTPEELVSRLDVFFTSFDELADKFKLEKLKTIGDAYMCAGGLPTVNKTHPVDACLFALQVQYIMRVAKELKQSMDLPFWELRLGIHTGPVVAGVIGKKKFAYDVWGDAVNTSARMESSGEPGRINISGRTYELVKDFFEFEYRGKIEAKNKGKIDMYFLNSLKKDLSDAEEGHVPNQKFWELYNKTFAIDTIAEGI